MSVSSRRLRLVDDLRRGGITDSRVLAVMEKVPREIFTPAQFIDQAYEDTALPIGHGQTLSHPHVVAFMTQALELGERMKVLEIGTGSGYQAAVLSRLCRRVYSIERLRALLREAEKRFSQLRLHNVTCKAGDGSRGWPEQAPFDRIIVTAAAVELPESLLMQLAVGGVMVVPVGKTRLDQKLLRLRRLESHFESEELCPVHFVPLVSGRIPD